MLCLDYLYYFQFHQANAMGVLIGIGLFCTHMAVACKWLSLTFPRWDLMALVLGDGKDCGCHAYWATSLLSYVSAFYLLKLLLFKKLTLIIQNPIFGNDRGVKAIPKQVGSLLCAQVLAYFICEFMMVHKTSSHCTDENRWKYDVTSPFACHDQVAAANLWFAVSAISADFVLFTGFVFQWHMVISTLMEEIALPFIVQHALICIGMISCCCNAAFHYYLLVTSDKVEEFDTFIGTGVFCVDCAVVSSCLVLSITKFQKVVAEKMGLEAVAEYYRIVEESGYASALFA